MLMAVAQRIQVSFLSHLNPLFYYRSAERVEKKKKSKIYRMKYNLKIE